MKLTVLVDNNTLIDHYFIGEPGLSFLLETSENKILFDTGYSDAFIKNAVKMNINLFDVDHVVLSHGHLDHTWGLLDLVREYTTADFENQNSKRPSLLAHPITFQPKSLGNLREINSLLPLETLNKQFDVKVNDQPVWITDQLVFLGEIPRKNDFEAQTPIGEIEIAGKKQNDFIMDDTALAYKASKGLIIISGCAHAGICNTIDYARQVCHENRIHSIIGGLHLLNPSPKQLTGTMNFLESIQPETVYACHCTDLASKISLASVSNIKEVGVGLVIEFPD